MKSTTKKGLKVHFEGQGYYLTDEDFEYFESIIEEDKTIGWSNLGDAMRFKMKDGRQIALNTADSSFVCEMRTQPVQFRIQAMDLTVDEMNAYISDVKKDVILEIKSLFKKQRKYRETGEPARFEDTDINMMMFELDKEMSIKQIIKAIEKGEISVKKAFEIVEIIENDTYTDE